jgi:hypothetical protein
MNNIQIVKSDMATKNRREMADEELSNNRLKNDLLTEERRVITDRNTRAHRLKNDKLTANRRILKDRNGVFAISKTIDIIHPINNNTNPIVETRLNV